MKKLKHYLLSFSLLIISSHAMADSPLTSTDLGAFQNGTPQGFDPENRTLTNHTASQLMSPQFSLETKLQLINGYWTYPSSSNSPLLLNYLANGDIHTPTTQTTKELLYGANADTVILYAYLLALDDYFDVVEALGWAMIAQQKNPNSRAISMTRALIEAQVALDYDWCKVYQIVDNVRTNTALSDDFSPESVATIFEYISIYEESCL